MEDTVYQNSNQDYGDANSVGRGVSPNNRAMMRVLRMRDLGLERNRRDESADGFFLIFQNSAQGGAGVFLREDFDLNAGNPILVDGEPTDELERVLH